MKTTTKIILSLALLLLLPGKHYAQHSVPADHPRVWLTPEWKSQLQQKRSDNTAEWQDFISMADNYLTQSVSWGHAQYALLEALAYQMTGDDQYAARAHYFLGEANLDNIDPGNANSYRREGMRPVVVFDWIYDYLVAEGLAQDYVDLFHSWSDYNYTHPHPYGDTDHLISVARNMALAGIATYYEDPVDAPVYLDYALDSIWFGEGGIHEFIIDDISKGGVFHEGTFYSDGTLNYLYEFSEAIKSAKGIDVWENTNFPQSHILATIHLRAPDNTWYVYGDVENSNDFDNYSTPGYYNNILKAIRACKGTDEAAYGTHLLTSLQEPLKFSSIEKFLWSEPSVSAVDYTAMLDKDFYSEGMGMVISRTEWTNNGTYMAFQCKGVEADHMQDDALSFNIQRKGVWITKEASGYFGTKYSDFHNTLLIENFSRNGSTNDERHIGTQSPRGFEEDGTIEKLTLHDDYVYIKADATGLYNGDPNGWATDQSCSKAVRSFIFLKPDLFVVYDDTETKETSGDRWKKYVFHTQNEPVISGNTITDTYEEQKLTSTTLLPSDFNFTKSDMAVKYSDHEDWSFPMDQRNWQVHVQSQNTDLAEQFLHVIAVGDAATSLPESEYLATTEDNMVGTLISSSEPQVVLFAKNSATTISENINYTADYTGLGQHSLADLEANTTYTILKEGTALTTAGTDDKGLLRFSSNGGGSFTISKGGADTTPPIAGFHYNTDSWCTSNEVGFTNTSTGDEPMTFSWTFENATPTSSTEENPVITAIGSSDIIITLEVNNAGGSDETSITVEPADCHCGGDHGSIYYVTEGGSDANSGTSREEAFATLSHAESVVEPGDSVKVANGSYDGFYVDVSGTQTDPIVFIADGNEVNITSDNGTTPDGINIENAAWVIIDGFKVNNRTRAGIRVALSDHVTVRNNSCFYNGRWGIFTGFAEDIIIENNECAYSGDEHGIYHSNSADNPIIRYNTCHHNNANGIHMNGDAGQGGDGMISNARIYGNVIYENGTAGGSGINCDGVESSFIYNNLLYDNHASGISLYSIDGATGSSNNKVYNNTVINASDGRWCLNIMNASNDNEVYNNIFINKHSWRGAITLDASVTSLVSDYNLVTNRFTTNDASSVIDLEDWQALGRGANSMIVSNMNDIFVDPNNDDYGLQATSPAIDAGTDAVSSVVNRDINNNPRPVNSGYDVGCYEYQSVFVAVKQEEPGAKEADTPSFFFNNPMKKHEVINVSLPYKSTISFQLINNKGLSVLTIPEKELKSGQHLISLDKSTLQPGIYLLVGKIAGQTSVKRIILL